MRYALYALVTLALLASPVLAQNNGVPASYPFSAVTTITTGETVFDVVAANTYNLGKSQTQAAGWGFTALNGGTVNLDVTATYSDRKLGATTAEASGWETGASLYGSTVTTMWNIGASPRRTDLRFLPSGWVKLEMKNKDSKSVMKNWFSIFHY
jgi:hypothetical protein